jgi:excisionase family DNA binding protein
VKRRTQQIPTVSEAVAAGEGYLDKVAVSIRLGVKPKTVGEWANQGKLPAYRMGRRLRFKWAEVEAHLAATCRVGHGELECSRKDAKTQSF